MLLASLSGSSYLALAGILYALWHLSNEKTPENPSERERTRPQRPNGIDETASGHLASPLASSNVSE